MIGRWLSLIAARLIARVVGYVIGLLVLVTVAIAAAPVSVVAAGAVLLAWWRGWQPRRLLVAAAWCGPMVAVWLVLTARAPGGWAAATPYHVWLAFWQLAGAGAYPRAAVSVAPVAIPLGLVTGALAWSSRVRAMAAGVGGLSPAASVAFDQRQWRHQVRAARARIAAPGAMPLLIRGDQLVVGAMIRTVGHQVHQAGRAWPIASVSYQRVRSHQIVVGTTGTGKTTLLLRLWAGFMAAGLRRHAAGLGAAPLLVVLDCKGGSDARRIADRYRRVLRDAGARSVAIWPDEASLSLWCSPGWNLAGCRWPTLARAAPPTTP